MLTTVLGNGLILLGGALDIVEAIEATSPVIYWPCDDLANPLTDEVGTRHQTDESGTVAYGVTGSVDAAVRLGTAAGASGGAWWTGADVSENIFEAASDWTIMFMFKLLATGTGRTLLSLSGDLANPNRIVVTYSGTTVNGDLRMNIIDENGTTRFNGDLTSGDPILRDGSTWHHATIRSNAATGVVRARVDGVDYTPGTHPAGGQDWQTWMFQLGATKTTGGAISVDGRQEMQHCAVWDRELTDTEIESITAFV